MNKTQAKKMFPDLTVKDVEEGVAGSVVVVFTNGSKVLIDAENTERWDYSGVVPEQDDAAADTDDEDESDDTNASGKK